MAWDRKFDPITQDFVRDTKGSWQTTEAADTAVFHQMLCHYRKWWGDSEAGSNLFDLKSFQRDPKKLCPLEAKRCLGRLLDRGRIQALEVIAESPKVGRVNVAAKFRDSSTGQLVKTFVKAGG